MTIRYELTKRIHRKKLVTKCIYPSCNLYKVGNEWIEDRRKISRLEYRCSGGLCPEHLKKALEFNHNNRRKYG